MRDLIERFVNCAPEDPGGEFHRGTLASISLTPQTTKPRLPVLPRGGVILWPSTEGRAAPEGAASREGRIPG